MGPPGAFLTLSISEFHSAAAASSLSDILETGALPQRYFLSAKACAGILRRAERRGKELPAQLQAALTQAAAIGASDSKRAAALLIANPLGAKADGGWRGGLDNDTYVAYGLDCENLGHGGNVGWHDAANPSITLNTGGNVGVAHSLRAEGFDASEDGTGRGTPLIAAPLTHGVDSQGKGGYAGRRREDDTDLVVTHALDAHSAGAATEDGTGRGVPLTLAIRGRGDSHGLEYRQDGIANAILTPNGGRAGIGVGAVAFDTTQITARQVLQPQAWRSLSPAGGRSASARRRLPPERPLRGPHHRGHGRAQYRRRQAGAGIPGGRLWHQLRLHRPFR